MTILERIERMEFEVDNALNEWNRHLATPRQAKQDDHYPRLAGELLGRIHLIDIQIKGLKKEIENGLS